jgi:hypothetical protein
LFSDSIQLQFVKPLHIWHLFQKKWRDSSCHNFRYGIKHFATCSFLPLERIFIGIYVFFDIFNFHKYSTIYFELLEQVWKNKKKIVKGSLFLVYVA